MKKIFALTFFVLFTLLSSIPVLGVTMDDIEYVNVNSNYVSVAEIEDGQIKSLFSKNADAKMYPASMTKMLTNYTAILRVDDPNMMVTIQPEDLSGLAEAQASVAGFKVGEQYTFKEVLFGSMLPSGADASNALARVVSGSIENFVIEMNEVAQSLDMMESNFVNTSGLFDENHYTTPNDLMKLMASALENPLFKEVFSQLTYQIDQNEHHPNGLTLRSTLLDYAQGDQERIGYISGGKTGWVPEAGYCLASFSQHMGKIVVVITGEAYEYGSQLDDHNGYYQFLFDNEHDVLLLEEEQKLGEIDLIFQDNPQVFEVITSEAVSIQLPLLFDADDLKHHDVFVSKIETPVYANTPIGSYIITLNDEEVYHEMYFIDREIERNDWLYYRHQINQYVQSPEFVDLMIILAAVLIAIIVLVIISNIRRKKRIRKSGLKGYHFDKRNRR